LIEAAIPSDTSLPEVWPACAALLPHAQTALAYDSDGMSRLVNYLGRRGSYGAALELQQRIHDASARSFGPEDPALLTARHDLAFWTGEAGDPAGARDQFAALLPVIEQVHGPEHPRTLSAHADLAHWIRCAGSPGSGME